MLIAKIFINEEQIDEIHIQNKGPFAFDFKKEYYRYKLRKPEGFENAKFIHKRELGYRSLLANVLNFLIND